MDINEEKCIEWINSLLLFAKQTVELNDNERKYASEKLSIAIEKYKLDELNKKSKK